MVDPALQVSHEEVRGDSSMNELIWKVAEAITDGKVDRHLVENLPSDYFGIDANIKSILKSLINETDVDYSFFYNYYYNNYNEDKANCTSNDCLATLKQFYGIVEAMYEANPSPNLPFGSLLSWFLPQEYEQFSNDVKILGMNSLDVDSYFIEQKQAYLNAHDLFTELTKYYGFKANKSISLFDIPAIMSENTDSNQKEKVRASQSYAFYMTQNNITQAELNRCYNVWNAYSVDQTGKKHPCEEDCCNKGPKSMGNNLEAIMRVMRIARGRGKARFNLTEILQKVINDEEMRHPIRFRKEDLEERKSIKDANAVIPFCELSDATNNEKTEDGNVITHEPECHLFDPVITNVGICHAFNAIKTSEMLELSYFKQSFENAFKSDAAKNSSIWNGRGSGEDYSLTFYLLDNNAIRRMTKSSPIPFRISLSTMADYLDFTTTNQIVNPGYHTILKVQAMEIAPSNDLHELPVVKRNCRFPDEASELNIFKVYSNKACLLECHIKKASDVCRCHPWFIPPKPGQDRHELCDHFGNHCFKLVMKQTRLSNNCSEMCLPTCHHIEFTHISERKPLDSNEACDGLRWQSSIMAIRMTYLISLIKNNGYNSLVYNYLKAKEWTKNNLGGIPNSTFERWNLQQHDPAIEVELCQKIVKHMAVVTVMFDKDTYVRTKTSLRVSSSDKLAAFGKLI